MRSPGIRRVARGIVIWSTAVVVGAVGLVATGGGPAYANGLIQVANTGSHKCLTVVNGTGLVQLPCTTITGQDWIFLGTPGTPREVRDDSGLCMRITNFANGAPVVMSDCGSGDPGLFWSLNDLTPPFPTARRTVFKSYTQNFCLDLENGETQDWVPLQVWTCNPNTNNQKWDVGSVNLSPPTTHAIVGLGKCLDVNQGSNANGTQIQIYHCNRTPAQLWTVPGDGVTGPMQALGKCLDLTSGAVGSRAILWDCNGSVTQQWFHSFSHEYVNPATNECLDIIGANSADFTPVQLWTCNQTLAQQWG